MALEQILVLISEKCPVFFYRPQLDNKQHNRPSHASRMVVWAEKDARRNVETESTGSQQGHERPRQRETKDGTARKESYSRYKKDGKTGSDGGYLNEGRHEKTSLQDFQPGPTQTNLYNLGKFQEG